jgi:hypothetical protein
MKPTKAGVIENAAAASCTDSTNTSLTSATSTVMTASVPVLRPPVVYATSDAAVES